MSGNDFNYSSPEMVSTQNGSGELVVSRSFLPTFPADEFSETDIYDDAIESVDLGALLTQGKETGVPTGK